MVVVPPNLNARPVQEVERSLKPAVSAEYVARWRPEDFIRIDSLPWDKRVSFYIFYKDHTLETLWRR